MNQLVKSLIGVGLAGGGAGLSVGGYYLFKFSKSTTLLEKFKKKGIEILDYQTEHDATEWSNKLTEYTEGSEKFEELETIEEDDLQTLKEKCRKYLQKSVEEINPDLETKIKKWCTKATSPSS